MAITALPDSTIHLLGSAQALTTPTSLVKELVDNALDAKATSIDILISPNTIDKIEVRDNGHGIPLDDLDALGRRGHTSKMRSFEDLKFIGGVSLGFRGEALASAVQLGLVSVTTRTEGEVVATSVQLKAPGGIASQSRTSHPIGTKVSITKFLYNLPVRKQTAEKESAKTLRKVKELLQAYAFARSKVRFCLRVTSGGKGSWSFTPRPNDGMKEAASQIIGRDAAAQCIERSLSFSEKSFQVHFDREENAAEPAQVRAAQGFGSDQFIVEVFMPKPKATSIGHGQYVSIDTRPVSHEKGTMRKIVSIYKYYAKGSILEGEERLKDPFLWLNIKCPVSSYDPNVEPAKDDVIFQNESLILESTEKLFKDVYGTPAATSDRTVPQNLGLKSGNFELLMSRDKNSSELPISVDHANIVQTTTATVPTQISESDIVQERNKGEGAITLEEDESDDEPESSNGRNWSVDMSKEYSEDVEDLPRSNRSSQILRNAKQPATDSPFDTGNSLNPWIISKMTAPVQPQSIVDPHASADPIPLIAAVSMPRNLPSPQRSFDPVSANAESLLPINTAVSRHMVNRDIIHTSAPPAVRLHSPVLGPRGEPAKSSTPLNNSYPTTAESDEGLLLGDDSEVFRRRIDFDSARNVLDGPMQRFSRQSGAKKPNGANKPFIPPTRAVDFAMPQDGLRQTILTGGTIYPAKAQNNHVTIGLEPDQNAELEWAMDFEHRKEHATRQRRKAILVARAEAEADTPASMDRRRRQQEIGVSLMEKDHTNTIVKTSPHKNRYNAAIADLESIQAASRSKDAAKSFLKTSLPDGDPRAYLMRRQKSMQPAVQGGPLKPMRAKLTRLPLEKIPEAQNMHKLRLRYPVDISAVQDAVQKFTAHDMYIYHGSRSKGLPMNVTEAKLAEGRIHAVVEKWKNKCPEETCEVEYNFQNLVQ